MSKKVMAVDDSPTVRTVLKSTLTDAGYIVVEASNGQEAMRMLEECKIDLLVTDLNMPKMNGLELIRALRKTPGYRFIPIIMLTSETQIDLKTEGRKAGASGWVTKPFCPNQLLAVTRMVCPEKAA
ncbi:MAG: two-component system response regulator [Desulfuromonas sp.]|nr:MAG: two-component system response regulator [Desulfuromonas sp.]